MLSFLHFELFINKESLFSTRRHWHFEHSAGSELHLLTKHQYLVFLLLVTAWSEVLLCLDTTKVGGKKTLRAINSALNAKSSVTASIFPALTERTVTADANHGHPVRWSSTYLSGHLHSFLLGNTALTNMNFILYVCILSMCVRTLVFAYVWMLEIKVRHLL